MRTDQERRAPSVLARVLPVLALGACSGGGGVSAPPIGEPDVDRGRLDTEELSDVGDAEELGDAADALDTPDPPPDLTPLDAVRDPLNDPAPNPDVIIDEPWQRPDLGEGPTDATPIDVLEIRLPPDLDRNGTVGCYQYELQLESDSFDLKSDRIWVRYQVINACTEPIDLRVAHLSDFFPIAITQNGDPWIFLPDCPGIGEPVERTFRSMEGMSRGWAWEPEDHEARMARCGVTFDPDADYAVVGFANEPLDPFDPIGYSSLYPLTDAIPISLRE